MKAPSDKTVVFTFESHPMKDLAKRWTAKLTFPPGATAETLLSIEVVDGNGESIREGVFEFANKNLPVADGAASISFFDFVAGKHAVELWLHLPDGERIPGGLTFR